MTLTDEDFGKIRVLFFRIGVSMGQMDAAMKGPGGINRDEIRTAMAALYNDMHDLGDTLHATDRVRLGEKQGGKR